MKIARMPILPIALLVIYCLWFFLIIAGSGVTPVQLVALGFGIVACITPLLLLLAKKSEYVGRATLWSITYVFVVLELLASVIIILVKPEEWQIPFFIQALILIIYIGLFVLSLRANVATVDAQAKTQKDRRLHQGWTARLKPLTTDYALSSGARKDIERAYDALRSLPVKSIPETDDIDALITLEVQSLVNATQQNNDMAIRESVLKIQSLAQERKTVLLELA